MSPGETTGRLATAVQRLTEQLTLTHTLERMAAALERIADAQERMADALEAEERLDHTPAEETP